MASALFKTLWDDLLFLFFPSHCIHCGEVLVKSERHYCLSCSLLIPKTSFHRIPLNAGWERLEGRAKIEKVASYFYYNKGSIGQKIIQDIKYKNNPHLAVEMGRLYAEELKHSAFIDDIDLLVPVPLHPFRLHKRGYNQSEQIITGLTKVLDIPYDSENLYRRRANKTQTGKTRLDRWRDTQNLFAVRNPELFEGKHILLVDDVLTTGATLESAARALLSVECKVSILTLAIAE